MTLGGRLDWVRLNAQKYYRLDDWNERNYNTLFSDLFVLEAGNQILTNPVFNYWNASAVAGLTWKTNTDFNLGINYVLSQRAPNPAELFSDGLHHSLASIELGDLQIEKETTHKVLLNFSRERKNLTFEVKPYVALAKNYIYAEPTSVDQTTRGAFLVWEYKQQAVAMWGVDVELTYAPIKHTQFKTDFSYLKGETRNPNTPLILIPPPSTSQEIITSFGKRKQWQWRLNSRYVFEQKHFPDNNFPIDVIENGIITSKIVDISTPPMAFHLVNSEITLFLKNKKSTEYTFRVMANNIFNTSYRRYLDRLRYYADAMGRNFQFQLILKY